MLGLAAAVVGNGTVAACTESYGWMPCSTNGWGGLFLAVVYGYLVLRGAMMIGDGGEALMDLKLAPAIIGGVVLPVIGALPDALIIINSVLHASRSEAREEISVGMGTLAGSTVMLLTIVWGGSVLLGRCDLDPDTGAQRDKTLTARWHDLTSSGVSTDEQTTKSARAMLASAGLFVFIQVSAWLVPQEHPRRHAAVPLTGAILCFLFLAAYCAYQVLTPAARRRRILAIHKHALRCRAVRSFSYAALRFGGLLDTAGGVRRDVTSRLFHKFRRDDNGCLDANDIRSMLIGLEIAKPRWSGTGALDERGLDEHVALWMREFDKQGAGHIDEEMFYEGVKRWVAYKLSRSTLQHEPKFQKVAARDPVAAAQQLLVHVDEHSTPLLVDLRNLSGSGSDYGEPHTEDSETDIESSPGDADSTSTSGDDSDIPPSPWEIALKAGALLAGGTALCAVFSDPLVGAVTDVSRASGVHPFFLAFIFMPLASNASELVSSLAFAAGQTTQRISVTFNQVYGAVVLNSTLCLGCFLSLVYAKRLPWTFTSEVLVILAPTLLLGALGATRRSWPAAFGLAALAVYPVSLLMQYLLMNVAGLG